MWGGVVSWWSLEEGLNWPTDPQTLPLRASEPLTLPHQSRLHAVFSSWIWFETIGLNEPYLKRSTSNRHTAEAGYLCPLYSGLIVSHNSPRTSDGHEPKQDTVFHHALWSWITVVGFDLERFSDTTVWQRREGGSEFDTHVIEPCVWLCSLVLEYVLGRMFRMNEPLYSVVYM